MARLYADGEFEKRLKATFDGNYKLKFNLAPPLFSKRDAQGHLIKAAYGSWVWRAFKLLAKLKFLRGTALDIFGKTAERRMERQLITDYVSTMEDVLGCLSGSNLNQAIELAGLPEQIRGFGHVKHASVDKVRAQWRLLHQAITGRVVVIAPSQRAA